MSARLGPLRLLSVVLTFGGLTLVTRVTVASARRQPTMLNVRLIPQETGLWCWAASAQMILDYYKRPVSQCEQANHGLPHNQDCCLKPTPDECIRVSWPDFQNYGLKADTTHYAALTWDQLQQQIANGYPVAMTLEATGGGGHMMVVYGVGVTGTDSLVYIKDPMPVDSGSLKVYKYAAYVQGQGYTHWNDYYNIRP
jgi:hypothetical protein